MQYVRGLKFEERPDYSYLRKLLNAAFARQGAEFDYVYDWIVKKQRSMQQKAMLADQSLQQPAQPKHNLSGFAGNLNGTQEALNLSALDFFQKATPALAAVGGADFHMH